MIKHPRRVPHAVRFARRIDSVAVVVAERLRSRHRGGVEWIDCCRCHSNHLAKRIAFVRSGRRLLGHGHVRLDRHALDEAIVLIRDVGHDTRLLSPARRLARRLGTRLDPEDVPVGVEGITGDWKCIRVGPAINLDFTTLRRGGALLQVVEVVVRVVSRDVVGQDVGRAGTVHGGGIHHARIADVREGERLQVLHRDLEHFALGPSASDVVRRVRVDLGAGLGDDIIGVGRRRNAPLGRVGCYQRQRSGYHLGFGKSRLRVANRLKARDRLVVVHSGNDRPRLLVLHRTRAHSDETVPLKIGFGALVLEAQRAFPISARAIVIGRHFEALDEPHAAAHAILRIRADLGGVDRDLKISPRPQGAIVGHRQIVDLDCLALPLADPLDLIGFVARVTIEMKLTTNQLNEIDQTVAVAVEDDRKRGAVRARGVLDRICAGMALPATSRRMSS